MIVPPKHKPIKKIPGYKLPETDNSSPEFLNLLQIQRKKIEEKFDQTRLKKQKIISGFPVTRLSPFLILATVLPFLFLTFLVITELTILRQILLVCLLAILEVNLLFIDFALWNYFEGKRKPTIWLIELSMLVMAGMHFFYR